jgi:hypothetical protein
VNHKARFLYNIRTPRATRRPKSLNELLCEREEENGNGSYHIPTKPPCYCDECVVNGRRQEVPIYHDCGYVAARSALVFEASKIATQRVGDATGSASLGYIWTAEFVRQMDRLAFNAGLLR